MSLPLQDKERRVNALADAWKALARDAKASCEKSIEQVSSSKLSDNADLDAELKRAIKKSHRDGYELVLETIIECAGRK